MNTTSNPRVTIRLLTVFEDASGVTALLAYDGADGRCYRYACQWIGEARVTLVAPTDGSRRESKIATRACRVIFDQLVQLNTTADWRDACARMYGEAVAS